MESCDWKYLIQIPMWYWKDFFFFEDGDLLCYIYIPVAFLWLFKNFQFSRYFCTTSLFMYISMRSCLSKVSFIGKLTQILVRITLSNTTLFKPAWAPKDDQNSIVIRANTLKGLSYSSHAYFREIVLCN